MLLAGLRKNGLLKKDSTKHYFCLYSFLFVCLALLVYSSFLIFGKSFVWADDGMSQHYPALAYFGWWIREIVKNIFKGDFSIPVWDFSMGYGADIITTLHYYGVGDPLSFFSVFVPTRYSEYLYDFLILFRLYLAGWFFVLFCKRMKQDVRISVLGAFLYVFGGYAMYAGVRHPFFLTPLVYLPLILIGVEKIFFKENPALFIISVALATLSNFYFAFMLIIFTVIYVIVRYFSLPLEKTWKQFLSSVVKFAGFGLIGILISCIILLPIIMVYTNTARSAQAAIPLVYPLSYYENLFAGFVGFSNVGYWNLTGYSPLSLISVFYMFSQRKRYKTLKIFFVILMVFQLFPVFGYLICGMLYVINRWIWAFSFLLSFISVYTFKDIFEATSKEKKKLLIFSAIYVLLSIFIFKGASNKALSGIALFVLMLVVVSAYDFVFKKNKKLYCSVAISLLCVVSIVLNSCYMFSPIFDSSYIYQFADSSKALEKSEFSAGMIFKNELKTDKNINRYDNKIGFGSYNQSLFTHTNSISYYWSFCENTIPAYLDEMEVNNRAPAFYTDINHRTFLNSLASVKYYIEGVSGPKPYGYDYVKSKTINNAQYRLYQNVKSLPIGYTYDNYINRAEYEKLNSVQKQEALMQSVLLENDVSNYKTNEYTITNSEIPYKLTYDSGIIAKDDGVYVTKANASLILEFNGLKNSETYFRITNMNAQYLDEYELRDLLPEIYEMSNKNESAINKQMRSFRHLYKAKVSSFNFVVKSDGVRSSNFLFTTPENQFQNGKKNFTINLGYSEAEKTYCSVSFPSAGYYSWDDMQIICQPMDNYENYVSNLSQNKLENITVTDNKVNGTIELQEPKILCLSVPYSKGWTAYVDGVETELLRANTWCMALDLGAGEHTVELRYKTPGLTLGVVATGIGLVLLGAVCIVYKRKKHNNQII